MSVDQEGGVRPSLHNLPGHGGGMLEDYIKSQYEAFLAEHPIFRIEDAIRWRPCDRLVDHEPEPVWYSLRPPARVPRDAEFLPARFVRIAGPAADHGTVGVELHRRPVRVYSVEKTLADCLKFRHLVGERAAHHVYRRALAESRLDRDAFADAARICRVRSAAKPLLMALETAPPTPEPVAAVEVRRPLDV
ncbi:MAG: type IV toxin-antitoxin system AbiEi family antitoxin domain-containing protein [Myxococcaceae bacterium]